MICHECGMCFYVPAANEPWAGSYCSLRCYQGSGQDKLDVALESMGEYTNA